MPPSPGPDPFALAVTIIVGCMLLAYGAHKILEVVLS